MSKSGAESREKSAALMEICSVRLGNSLYGMPITHILEIVGAAHPQPVPLAPGFVGGLAHYRGEVLTTVSLRHLLGMPPYAGTQDILVLECASGCFGLLVDSVGEVLTVARSSYESNPSTLDECRKTLFDGTYKLKDSLLVMLDPERLDPLKLGAVQPA